jgi:hypothetical protein
MSDLRLSDTAAQPAGPSALLAAQAIATCEDCLGSGGWYRYEPAMEPAPGMLYLSCMQCRGSGRAGVLRPE